MQRTRPRNELERDVDRLQDQGYTAAEIAALLQTPEEDVAAALGRLGIRRRKPSTPVITRYRMCPDCRRQFAHEDEAGYQKHVAGECDMARPATTVWTAELDAKLRELWVQGLSGEAIGEELGLKASQVYYRKGKLFHTALWRGAEKARRDAILAMAEKAMAGAPPAHDGAADDQADDDDDVTAEEGDRDLPGPGRLVVEGPSTAPVVDHGQDITHHEGDACQPPHPSPAAPPTAEAPIDPPAPVETVPPGPSAPVPDPADRLIALWSVGTPIEDIAAQLGLGDTSHVWDLIRSMRGSKRWPDGIDTARSQVIRARTAPPVLQPTEPKFRGRDMAEVPGRPSPASHAPAPRPDASAPKGAVHDVYLEATVSGVVAHRLLQLLGAGVPIPGGHTFIVGLRVVTPEAAGQKAVGE